MHCSTAKVVWFSSPLGIHIPPNDVCRDWMEQWLKKDDTLVVQIYGITLWRLWQGRNLLIFKNTPFGPTQIAQSVVVLIEEFNLANKKVEGQTITRVPSWWCPPTDELPRSMWMRGVSQIATRDGALLLEIIKERCCSLPPVRNILQWPRWWLRRLLLYGV